jgi:hypothetical protein
MKPSERQELRRRHHSRITDRVPFCYHCKLIWPCDVIKVLNAWDSQYGSVEKVVEEYKEKLSGPEWDD